MNPDSILWCSQNPAFCLTVNPLHLCIYNNNCNLKSQPVSLYFFNIFYVYFIKPFQLLF